MLFWISLAVLVLGIVIGIIEDIIDSEVITDIGIAGIFIGFTASLIMIIFIIVNNCKSYSKLIELQERYNAINTKLSTEIYTDKFDINDKDIVDEIYEYNKDVRYGKHYQKDFWIGIFVPNIYDELETIDYNVIEKENN